MSAFRCPTEIKQNFAILDQVVNDEPLVYLRIMQQRLKKPQVVLDTLMAYYHEDNANVTVVITLG